MFFRRHILVQLVATLVCVAMFGEIATWAHGGDDPGCDPSPVLLARTAPQFAPPKAPTDADQHCILCHMQRLLNLALSGTPPAVVTTAATSHQWVVELDTTLRRPSLAVTSRGPPAEFI